MTSTSKSDSIWVGKGADAFNETYGSFADKVQKLSDSFTVVKTELNSFADTVSSYQPRADAALADAVEANTQKDNLSLNIMQAESTQRVTFARNQAVSQLDDNDSNTQYQKNQAASALSSANSQLEAFKAQLASVQADFDSAKEEIDRYHRCYDDEANRVAQKIQGAQETGDLHVGFFEAWFYSDVWRFTVKAAEVVGAFAGIAAIFLSGGGLLIAGILLTTSLISLIDTSVGMQVGEKDKGDFVFALANVVVSMVPFSGALSTFRSAKAAGKLTSTSSKWAHCLGKVDSSQSWKEFVGNNYKTCLESLRNPASFTPQKNPITGR